MMINSLNSDLIEKDLRYLKLLSKEYPTISSASTEIINLQAILNLPKATEHFISDIHGEYESFTHVLRNASGVIKRKIDDVFLDTLTVRQKSELATIIYYPEEKLRIIKDKGENSDEWYSKTLYKLIQLCKNVCSKYTRSKVRKALPGDFAYIIEELLHEQGDKIDKKAYYSEIIRTIINIQRADQFIIAISKVIRDLVVDRLHIVGDIYDRGPGAEIIMDALMRHHSVDVQWGNHDVLWMGAACGCQACVANVLRISLRYANLNTIEEGYGINILPLATFSMEFYGDDPCKDFIPRTLDKSINSKDMILFARMHKAITIIQFKLEGNIIKNHPEFNMKNRLLLDKIDIKNKQVEVDGKIYEINDTNFPTVDWKDPYKLTDREACLIKKLTRSFVNSEKLQRHIRFLYKKGSMYLVYNSNVMYHGCIPLNRDGSFKKVNIGGVCCSGKSFLDKCDEIVRNAYFEEGSIKKINMDMMWYMWCGEDSPLFGKEKMTTFERYFIDDKTTHHEEKIFYYKYRDNEDVCKNILEEFGLSPEHSHIINGHIPVKTKDGESAIKANGKLLVIDGGFCKAYQPQTGIAGYTLIYNSYGFMLTSHEPFTSIKDAVQNDKDIISSTRILEHVVNRKRVADSDIGRELKKQVSDLERLLIAYRKGYIEEVRK
ncbi:MAG: fructose-1,6-bisphosphatase [Clostridium sp.]|uniref:fructose-1,6-bisphosphatase n=1 Tax=Clostridium sp. TaxID=1506 RepID=UPI0025BB0527|nr:fructose-1,6-bisphosphatase [Clostridium sp.]MCH3963080.1 fructose-1,6-bisphosphatase [Clostridium sp.]MCI1716457.1 fructose-1,6-bisphosphatase [Clostridium sp.]MCI1800797.1 fructose-1,6-bisphosphatase [Clostridium sp.]MCI1814548.1 fructose-1,6-bisphosphatase [Clostridium sp.]MCI1871458.1 fructose-1,6-bisphosphatase [Clostridium sp.]